MRPLRLGTRASKLALWQANFVAKKLTELGHNVEIVTISTTGDKLYDANLALVGGKGLFLKELEESIICGNIDFAVHSMKDVPAKLNNEFAVHSVFEREDPRDAFISYEFDDITQIPTGKKIGTSSTRRAAIIRDIDPNLECIPFRGNVVTRLEKVKNSEVSGCILALAGLKRLGLDSHVKKIYEPDVFVPAVTQGILAVEFLKSNQFIGNILAALKLESCEFISQIERSFMFELEGNCTLPAALNAEYFNGKIKIRAIYYCNKSAKLYKVNEIVEKHNAVLRAKEIAINFKSL